MRGINTLRSLGVLSALLLALVPATTSQARVAGDKPPAAEEAVPFSYIPADVRAKMARQEPLTRAAHVVREAAERAGDSGFTSISLGKGEVVLHWKGRVTAAVNRAVEQARKTAPVRVQPAAFSLRELQRARDGYAEALTKGVVNAVRIRLDGSGLIVGTDPRASLAARGALPATGVPTQVTSEPAAVFESRLDDGPPWYGAARIINRETGSACSTGFGVTSPSGQGILTAGHCGRVGGSFTDGVDDFTANATLEDIGHDLLFIPASAGYRIYDGGVGTGEFTKMVQGWDWVFSGEALCRSGITTGAVCGFDILAMTSTLCGIDAYGNRECYNDLIEARPPAGVATPSANGDSGGPWFAITGCCDVIAKGTHTGSSGSNRVFQDFATAARDFGVTPA